ncbi:hypothetical protein MMC12_005255 [Toensbergia leucococca]|nr:hypothetical protein [Toensbergia leucococca]
MAVFSVLDDSRIRDQFTTTTWLLAGASVLFIAFRFVRAVLMVYGFTPNTYLDGVKLGNWTAQIPNEDGTFSEKSGDKEVVVFLLSARSNQ